MEENLCDERRRSEKSRNSADQETRISIRSDEESCDDFRGEKNGDMDGKEESGLVMKDKVGLSDGNGEEKYCCKIDVKCRDLEGEKNQKVCRICHLSRLENGKNLVDLIELGCGCKGELGFAHTVCAETWFKLRGNRYLQ